MRWSLRRAVRADGTAPRRADGWTLRRIDLVGSAERIGRIAAEWEDAGWLVVRIEELDRTVEGHPTHRVTVAVPPAHHVAPRDAVDEAAQPDVTSYGAPVGTEQAVRELAGEPS